MGKSSKPVSEIDRLIELASDEKPSKAVAGGDSDKSNHALSLEDQKDPRSSMWRVLLQLRVLLPYLAKVLPLVERGVLGTNITGQATAASDTSTLDRSIAGVGEAQRDLNTAVKAQTSELRLLHEQIAILNDSLEKLHMLSEDNATQLTSLQKLITNSMWVVFVLLAILIGLVAFAVFAHSLRVG